MKECTEATVGTLDLAIKDMKFMPIPDMEYKILIGGKVVSSGKTDSSGKGETAKDIEIGSRFEIHVKGKQGEFKKVAQGVTNTESCTANLISPKTHIDIATDVDKPVLKVTIYDEQIQFVNAINTPLVKINFTLRLADGSSISGVTDSAGKTPRFATKTAQAITEAILTPFILPSCCTSSVQNSNEEAAPLKVKIKNVTTNSNNVGLSVVKVVTAEEDARGLTAGEIAMARLIFKDAIDYSKVKVHRGEYLWLGMQPDNTVMAPDGGIYYNTKMFSEDFSKEDFYKQRLFMHEMVNVWQHQLGYWVKIRGAIRIGLDYRYTLATDKRLSDYNMEAQGDILSDYWALKFKGMQSRLYEEQYRQDSTDPKAPTALSLQESVLSDFLKDPKNKVSLP